MFVGLDGLITVRRARFQDSISGKMIVPADKQLDLPGGNVTVSLARRALRLSTVMSFEQLQAELVEQHDARLTDGTLDNLMQQAGGTAVADQKRELEALAGIPRGIEREQAVLPGSSDEYPSRLYVSCDGITYRTRYRETDPVHPKQKRVLYQEMKVGAVFWQDRKEKWHKQVVTGRGNPEEFGLDLWRLAIRCGMPHAGEVIFISDGGGWCNSVAQMYFKDACRILDWYHLSEHVWAAGRLLYPENEKGAGAWVEECLDHLHDNSGIGLLLHLERCHKARGSAADEALFPLLAYLRPRLAITDYVDYRKAGYVIGSGMMESSCKQVVGQRLKGPGMQWSEQGALAMSALVAHRINGTLQEFWASRPLQRAA